MSVWARAPERVDFEPIGSLRILLVEDTFAFAQALTRALAKAGHLPMTVARGADALHRHRDADLVLLDLLLPDGSRADPLGVLRRLRAVTHVPVVVLTAVGDKRVLVQALELGADDYVVKSAPMVELLARINTVVRRSRFRAQPPPSVVGVGDVEIDLAAHRVTVGDSVVDLTRKEFTVLAVLARHAGTLVSRKDLLDAGWGGADATRDRSLGVVMTKLRKKLNRPGLIVTEHGVGYRLEV